MELSNIDAEQGILGVLLADNRAYDRISDLVKPHYFAWPAHQRIFETIEKQINSGTGATTVSLKAHFDKDGDLEAVGGAGYLSEVLATFGGFKFNAENYARTIRELYIRRALVIASQEIKALAEAPDQADVLSETERIITGIVDSHNIKEFSALQAAQSALDWMNDVATGTVKPLKTGIRFLDEKVKGLFPGRLYIVGARPGMGKTAFALTVADNISRYHPCLFLSLEMTKEELAMRQKAMRTGISVDRQQEAEKLSQDDWKALIAANQDVEKLALTIIETAGLSLTAVRSAARRFKRRKGNFVLFIDYLGLMSMDGGLKKVHQIEQITTALKGLAKELEIPVVLLSQLSRELEKRDNKRPGLADLRDSGAIEQDADVVLFVNRPEVYLAGTEPVRGANEGEGKYMDKVADWQAEMSAARGKAEIIIGKNRQGTGGIVVLKFDGERQTFS